MQQDIRQQLALSAASQEVLNAHDRFEDIRASGATLEEAASELHLKAQTVTADASGNDQDGDKITRLPEDTKLIADAFRTEPRAQPLPVSIGNDRYVWFAVGETSPETGGELARDRETGGR